MFDFKLPLILRAVLIIPNSLLTTLSNMITSLKDNIITVDDFDNVKKYIVKYLS